MVFLCKQGYEISFSKNPHSHSHSFDANYALFLYIQHSIKNIAELFLQGPKLKTDSCCNTAQPRVWKIRFKWSFSVPLVHRDYQIYLLMIFFTEFIEGVSQFSVKGDKLSKLKCKFTHTINNYVYPQPMHASIVFDVRFDFVQWAFSVEKIIIKHYFLNRVTHPPTSMQIWNYSIWLFVIFVLHFSFNFLKRDRTD